MKEYKKFKIEANESLLLVVDLQERLVPALDRGEQTIKNSVIMIECAKLLGVDIMYTLQYPKGLGANVPQIQNALPQNAQCFEKTEFSCYGTIKDAIKSSGKKNVFIVGAEAHVCIFQTVRDLIEDDYNVYIVSDACTARNSESKLNAFENIRQMGGCVISTESLLLIMTKDSKHEHFKQISTLIK